VFSFNLVTKFLTFLVENGMISVAAISCAVKSLGILGGKSGRCSSMYRFTPAANPSYTSLTSRESDP
jgi:hypothetical protein